MIIMLSGPDKRIGFSKDVKKFLNKELNNCNSLVAIAASDCAKKMMTILMALIWHLVLRECLIN